MKKLLFLLAFAFAAFQMNAQDENYVAKWGKLKLNGNQLVASDGTTPVQLRGWSTFGLQWNVSCYNKSAFEQMKAWGATIVRLAMYVYEGGASSNMDNYITKVKEYIKATSDLGMYCLVDWHVLTPGQPSEYLNNKLNNKGAEYFFDAISKDVATNGYKHVLYELCNEPNHCSWSDIKSYANTVIPNITKNDKNAIIIVGTPQWDQLPKQAANDKISASDCYIMYSFHYYACSHVNFLEEQFKPVCASLPIFVTEWGPVRFDGDGDFCEANADLLMKACEGGNDGKQIVSWCCWNWGDKKEKSSALESCSDWSLTEVGEYTKKKLCPTNDCKTIVTSDGPFGGEAQPIPTPANGFFEIAYYDLGGEGKAYHDGDGTPFERIGVGITEDEEGNTINEAVTCVTDNLGNICHCNAGYKYGGKGYAFRDKECVDVSSCYGLEGTYSNYNIGNREEGEWLLFTVNVEKPGYYSVKTMSNPNTTGQVDFFIEKDGENFGRALYNSATEAVFPSTATATMNATTKSGSPAWEVWSWEDLTFGRGGQNGTVLFKEAGELQLKITWPNAGGEVGPFKFTFEKAYNGEGYVSNEEVAANAESFNIYPNPTTGAFNIALVNAEEADVTVVNMMGQVVYTASIKGTSEINANLVAGNYIVTVKTANSVNQKKLIVK